MPRRFLVNRDPDYSPSCQRLVTALHQPRDRLSVEEVIETQDYKLQEIKQSMFSDVGGPIRLHATPPISVSSIVNIPSACHNISTHFNDNQQQSVINNEPIAQLSKVEIDFSKAEDFLQLETPIDARKDHNMLKIAYTIPKRSFMRQILRRFPINKKRLAFIQRRPPTTSTVESSNIVIGDGKEVSITCQVCGQRFTRQYQFQRHILTHPDPDNKKFLCQFCGKRFNRADHLNRHVMLHGDIKLQKCVLCGEEFDRASHLDRHRRKHHPPAGQQPSQTPPLTPHLRSPPSDVIMTGEAGFVGVGFVANDISNTTSGTGNNLHLLASVATPEGSHVEPSSAYQHINRINFGPPTPEIEPDRPFPCEVCGRKFIRATHLRRHMRIHTGEKPFACHICGRRYARGDYLRAHIHAHRRDKIHKCKHCGEVFQDLTRYADHCRLIHKDHNDEHGNPKPPPESSPPPIISTVLESTLAAESAENITVVPGMPLWDEDSQEVPITLVNLDSSHQEVILSHYHTPGAELHAGLTHLPPDNGHYPVHEGQEVTILSHAPNISVKPHPQGEYLDPVAQYILNNATPTYHTPHSMIEHYTRSPS